jgi:hypothetical protein
MSLNSVTFEELFQSQNLDDPVEDRRQHRTDLGQRLGLHHSIVLETHIV